MKERGIVTDTDALQLLYKMSQESTVIKAAEEQQAKILDADYSKNEMNEHVKSLDYLNAEQKSELLQAHKSYPTSFGCGLGRLNIEPIRLELKEGEKPYHAKPFAIPHAYEATTRTKTQRRNGLPVTKYVPRFSGHPTAAVTLDGSSHPADFVNLYLPFERNPHDTRQTKFPSFAMFTTWTNTKALMAGAGDAIYKEHKPFTSEEMRQHFGLYLLQGISPLPVSRSCCGEGYCLPILRPKRRAKTQTLQGIFLQPRITLMVSRTKRKSLIRRLTRSSTVSTRRDRCFGCVSQPFCRRTDNRIQGQTQAQATNILQMSRRWLSNGGHLRRCIHIPGVFP